jgi:hypothetical protein
VRAQPVAAETPQTMLSAQIRALGFTCDNAQRVLHQGPGKAGLDLIHRNF